MDSDKGVPPTAIQPYAHTAGAVPENASLRSGARGAQARKEALALERHVEDAGKR